MNKENNGLIILNTETRNEPYKTFIVLGAARGGTSMMAGVLAKLGVFMGGGNLAPFYENTEFLSHFKIGKAIKVKEMIATYNLDYALWVIKILPRWLITYLWYRQLFPQVVYVVIFRDIVAIANRMGVSMNKNIASQLINAIFVNFCLVTFLILTKRPVLLVSYEKALLNPESLIRELAEFLQIVDDIKIQQAIDFIKPSPIEYRLRSTTTCQLDASGNYFGYLDVINNHQIKGWALSTVDTNPLEIQLLINGKSKQMILATEMRVDVSASNPLFHLNSGFVFEFGHEDFLKKGDIVEVIIAKENTHLINSPYHFV